MKLTLTRRTLAAGVVAGLLATFAPLAAAHAADEPSEFPSGSDGPIYMIDGNTGDQIPAGTQIDWVPNGGVYGAASPMPTFTGNEEDLRWPVPPADAVAYRTFISNPGDERSTADWKAWGDANTLSHTEGVLWPQLSPYYQGLGAPATVKTNGGTYSLGMAYVKNNNLTVVSVYYTTINVDAGTGAWKFATPSTPTAKADTTTTVSGPASVGSGADVTLTATVAAGAGTPTGNVQFFDGTQSLGSAASVNGVATLHVSSLADGAHAIHAVYAGDSAFNASTSADFTVTVSGAPEESTLPAATLTVTKTGSAATIDLGAANNGKVVNVYGYSTPTFLGQYTVSGGTVTVNIAGLPAGEHTLAVVDTADASILGTGTITLTAAADGSPATRDIDADVAYSVDGNFKLIAPDNTNPAHLGSATLDGTGASVSTGTLGAFSVIDDRGLTKKGWDLTTDVADFTMGSETIAKSALGLQPTLSANSGPGTPVLGANQVAGAATYTSSFAQLAAGSYSPLSDFNADLTFKAPIGSAPGTYHSVLTLTLVSK